MSSCDAFTTAKMTPLRPGRCRPPTGGRGRAGASYGEAPDWRERERGDDYEKAYEDALSAGSTADAPWYVVPADHKWFRDLAVGDALVNAMRPYRDTWRATLLEMSRQRRAEIEAIEQ